MRRTDLVNAIAIFDKTGAAHLELRICSTKSLVAEVLARIFTHNITVPEHEISVIKMAWLLMEQQGSEFSLEEDDEVQKRIDEKIAKKQKYKESLNTPILSDDDKSKLYNKKFRKSESIHWMMGAIPPVDHKPIQWGQQWNGYTSTVRIVISMIKSGILEIVEYDKFPMYTVVRRGPRWGEAVEFYQPRESYKRTFKP